MAVNISLIGGAAAQFFDNTGSVLTGGKLYTYLAGSTTPAATYTSLSGATSHTNPIILDAAGRVPGGEIWVTATTSYKFALYTSTNVLIGTYDNIQTFTANAANVYYDPPGVGAVQTTVQAKLRESVSVKDFGAVGDGVTDDYAAIQAALDSGAGTIVVPPGSYYMTSGVAMKQDGQWLIGTGGELLIDDPSFSFTSVVVNCDYDYCRIASLIIRSATPGTWSGFYGINIGGDYIEVINCTFRDIRYNAILTNGKYGIFQNIASFNCGWDTLTFFTDTKFNLATNVYSYRSGRSAIGCDFGSSNNVVDGIMVIDNGSPLITDQHHDVLHFEGAVNSVYKNAEIYYTVNHPAHSSGLTDINAAVRFNQGGGCKIENVKVVYDTSCNKTLTVVVCDQNPNDVIVNNLTVINNTVDYIGSIINYQGTFPGIVSFDGVKMSGPTGVEDTSIGDVYKIFTNCYFNNVTNATNTKLFNSPFRSKNWVFDTCQFYGCENVFYMLGWIDSSITNCTFEQISGTIFQTKQFSAGVTYQPQRGVIAQNIFKGVIEKCFDFQNGLEPCLVTNNYFTGAINILVQSNNATGGVGGLDSRFSQNQNIGVIVNKNPELDSDCNQQGISDGAIAIRDTAVAVNETAVRLVTDFVDNTYKNLVSIESPGGFSSADYSGYLSGKLRVSFIGFDTLNQLVATTNVYLLRAKQEANGNIVLDLSPYTSEDTDDGTITPTITVQIKSGATATSATVEGKITFALFNSTVKPKAIVSFSYDTVVQGSPLTSLLRIAT